MGDRESAAARASAYRADSKAAQQRMLEALTQLGGVALLLLTGSGRATLCAAPVERAERTMADARRHLRAASPPDNAAHHHRHLSRAAAALERAIAQAFACMSMRGGRDEQDRLSTLLRAASDELQRAGRIVPGFETVDLREACCAWHRAAPAARFSATAC
ncbi:hypothetical protein [Ensifer soli]|uniref:hypothetical protein n=1 Tax=Ciceribacter sp. sgz301302 TaxID=3342379 RepID=UPI0035B77DAC